MENIAIGSVFEQLKILQSNLNEISEIVDNLNRSGVIEIRGKSNFAGGIKLNSSDNSKGITIQAPSSFSSNYTLTLPPGLPTAGQVLGSDTTGTLSWVNNGGNGGNGGGGITTETDPVFTSHVAHGITQNKIDNWDTAYSWGDHSLEGYLTDAHPVFNITDTDIDNWNRVEGYFGFQGGGYISLGFISTDKIDVYQDVHVGGKIFGSESTTTTLGSRLKLVSNDGSATVEIMGGNSTENRDSSAPEHAGAIQLNSFDNSKAIKIQAPPLSSWTGSGYTLTLPPGLPTAGQVLGSDTTGTLSWVNNGGNGGNGGGGITTETDPVFTSHDAYGITQNKIDNWDTSYSWGNHADQGYLTDAHPAHGITQNNIDNIDNWDTAYSWGDHSLSGYLTDAHPAHEVTSNKIDNWDTAYSWGDHSLEGYLTDAHPAHGVTQNKIDNWDTAYSWGNHADQGYLTDAHPAFNITSTDIANWNTPGGGTSTSSVNAETWGLRAVANGTIYQDIININDGGFQLPANIKAVPTGAALDLTGEIIDNGYLATPTRHGSNNPITGGFNTDVIWNLDNAGRTSHSRLVNVNGTGGGAVSGGGIFSFASTGLYMINFDFLLKGQFDTVVNVCLLTTTDGAAASPTWTEVRSGTTEFKYIYFPGNSQDYFSNQNISASYIFYVANTSNYKFKFGTRCWHAQLCGLFGEYGILTKGINNQNLSTVTIVKLS